MALEPSFTARVYRGRQLICGQYASWAAEMHMLHLPVAGYFPCPDAAIEAVDAGLATIAKESRRNAPQFPLGHQGVVSPPDDFGNIYLDFSGSPRPELLHALHQSVAEMLRQSTGLVLDAGASGESYQPHVALMQYANLPPAVFADAVEFARAVVDDLQVPASTTAWRLLLVRFQSQAAGDDWSGGSWAADLSWRLLSSYPL